MRQTARSNAWVIGAFTALLLSAGAAQASVEISTGATKNIACNSGVCSPTAKKAVLNVSDLTNMLAAGDVKVTTGAGAVTITVESPFSWTSTHRLTLDAYYNVSFRAAVTVAGQGAVTLTYNDGGTGGDLIFFPGGKLDFAQRGSLTINGRNYRLLSALDQLTSVIGRHPANSYALSGDIDATDYGTLSSSPVQKTFGGSFEGLGHAISNLTIDDRFDTCVGLFNRIDEGASVRNLLVTDANMRSWLPHYGRLGAIAGCNRGIVANSSVTGALTGVWVGGAVGYNEGIIANTGSHIVVRGKIAGGLVGASEGTILQSRAWGPVSGFFIAKRTPFLFDLGGLAGRAADIRESYASGSVTLGGVRPREGHYSGAGALVGRATGKIINSYATGAVQAGGITLVGGLIGQGIRGAVRYSYATGALSGSADGDSATGGIAGSAAAKLKFAETYWDIDSSGIAAGCGTGSCEGTTALSDTQLKAGLPEGFDPHIWGQNPTINNGYPYLLANPPPQ